MRAIKAALVEAEAAGGLVSVRETAAVAKTRGGETRVQAMGGSSQGSREYHCHVSQHPPVVVLSTVCNMRVALSLKKNLISVLCRSNAAGAVIARVSVMRTCQGRVQVYMDLRRWKRRDACLKG
jgi:hypothetical protein